MTPADALDDPAVTAVVGVALPAITFVTVTGVSAPWVSATSPVLPFASTLPLRLAVGLAAVPSVTLRASAFAIGDVSLIRMSMLSAVTVVLASSVIVNPMLSTML